MRKLLKLSPLLFLAFSLLPSLAIAQTGPGQQVCGLNLIPYGTTVVLPTDRQNCFQVTITGDVASTTLTAPYNGEWIYLSIIQDATGGHSYAAPANAFNWQPIDTRPYNGTLGSLQGVTTEEGYFWHGYWYIVSGFAGSSPAGCLDGASDTQYVDSAAGSDANSGLNWCASKLTEQAAVTTLGAGGGWIYVAPNYTGAAATGVPANVHILETNQLSTTSSSVRRFSFPDFTAVNTDSLSQFLGIHSTAAGAQADWLATNAFRSPHLAAGYTSELTGTEGNGLFSDDSPAILGIANMTALSDQAEGLEGICSINGDLANEQDCTGVVAVANSRSGSVGASSLEGVWSEIFDVQPVNNLDGYVARLTGGNTPPLSSGGLFSAAFDIRTPYTSTTFNDIWPAGIYMENGTIAQPIYLGTSARFSGGVRTPLADHGNDGVQFGYWYAASSVQTSQIRVTGNADGFFPVGGDFQFINNHANGTASTATVSLQTNATGFVSVDALNSVAFSATPTFDRSLGKIQKITLTANVTSSTLSNCAAGQTIIFDIAENATGGFTFVAPANLHGFGSITTTANFHNRQMFYCDGSSTNSGGYSTGSMQSGT